MKESSISLLIPPSSAVGFHVSFFSCSILRCRAASSSRCLMTSGSWSCSTAATSFLISSSSASAPHAPEGAFGAPGVGPPSAEVEVKEEVVEERPPREGK